MTTTNTAQWTCCERNISFPPGGVKVGKSAGTGLQNNNTRRWVQVELTFTLNYDCNSVPDQQCIADLAVGVSFRPRQADATGEFTDDPEEETVETIRTARPPMCDGKSHSTEITIRWRGVYRTRRQVKGELILELTVPAAKGTINHRLRVDVDAAGTSGSVEKPKLEKR